MNLIFDFDGTLADSLPAMIAVFNRRIRGDDPLDNDDIVRLRGMTSRRAIRSLGIRWWQVPKLLVQGMPDFKALVPTLKTFDGMPETLRLLQKRGDKLYIVTSNTRDSVEQFLELHGMRGYFIEAYTGAGLFNKSKHIRRLIKEHGLRRKETFYIGDETRDIQAARLARVRPVAVSWGFNTKAALLRRRPAYLVDAPKDLLKLR